ncbi:MAG: ABC transporter permease [Hasllibacter sp.]
MDGASRRAPGGMDLAGLTVAALVLVPVAAVAVMALGPATSDLPGRVMWRYASNTVLLAALVGIGATMIGTGCAWLATMHEFPGARWLRWALLLPLAVPAYVSAYALADLLEYAGPVQTALRATFGWTGARDYAFPDIRSLGGAAAVLTLSLYPYVYLLARRAFEETSSATWDSARALGAGPWRVFRQVALPLARPGIVAGAAIAMMEAAADYGTVDHYGVQTLVTGIFTTWLEAGDRAGAARIAVAILTFALLLLALERRGRAGARAFRSLSADRATPARRLGGAAGWAATAACAAPVLLGFALPVAVMAANAAGDLEPWRAAGLGRAAANTATVAALAAGVTVAAAIVLAAAARAGGAARAVLPATAIGYAAPGAVLGLGILAPLGALDNRLADGVLALTGRDPGLLLTGGVAALVYAYAVRFFAVAQGAADTAMGRVPPSMPLAARTLGRGRLGALAAVTVPMMRGSVLAALLLVFVDAAKELPATLLLRPFGFETLATRAHEQASLEQLGAASAAALPLIATGLVAVLLLARATRSG